MSRSPFTPGPSAAPTGGPPPPDAGGGGEPDATFYEVVRRRRDVRVGFTGEPAPPATLARVLRAGHAAPSVGMSQPWDFIVIDDPELRRRFHAHVQEQRQHFAASLPAERAGVFAPIEIDGILRATYGIAVTFDPDRGGAHVLGAATNPATRRDSVILAIANLWLAATAEGLGVGWVSFHEPRFLSGLLGLPDRIEPVAWLCLGPIDGHETIPDLERLGWRYRSPIDAHLHHNSWNRPTGPVLHAE